MLCDCVRPPPSVKIHFPHSPGAGTLLAPTFDSGCTAGGWFNTSAGNSVTNVCIHSMYAISDI